MDLIRLATQFSTGETIPMLLDQLNRCPIRAKNYNPSASLVPANALELALKSDLSHLSAIKMLLELGMDPNKGSEDGWFAMDTALSRVGYSVKILDDALSEHILGFVTLLLEHGALVERPKSTKYWGRGPSALQIAIRRGSFRIVKFLLDSGGDVDFYLGCHVPGYERSPLLTALCERRPKSRRSC